MLNNYIQLFINYILLFGIQICVLVRSDFIGNDIIRFGDFVCSLNSTIYK